MSIHPVSMDVESVVVRLHEQGRELCSQNGNVFIITADSALPVCVYADDRRLSQVLLNLISNAAVFTREGKVTMSMSCTRERGDALFTFTVQDDGPGIPGSQHAKVFDAFEQQQSRHGSAGLGLYIAHGIVHNMGGVLQLESSAGAGARFSFCLRVPVLSTETFRPVFSAGSVAATPPPSEIARIVAPPSIQPALGNLALYAKTGEITMIEQWLAENIERHLGAEELLGQIEQAAARLDLASIEQLACVGSPSGSGLATSSGPV